MYFLFVLFYVLSVCKCVLLPQVVNPTAVKYIISYQGDIVMLKAYLSQGGIRLT